MPRSRRFEVLSGPQLADYLESTYHAPETARLVREAATVYQLRGFLHR